MLSESAAALLLLAGIAIAMIGVFLWSIVAGLVASGICLCLLAILWNRGAPE